MEFIKLEDMFQVSWQFQKVCQTIELTYEIFSQVSLVIAVSKKVCQIELTYEIFRIWGSRLPPPATAG